MAAKPAIKPAENGPYLVRNLTRFSNQHGSIECQESMALCRCGGSANKPFCDGSHKKIGFTSAKSESREEEDRQQHFRGKRITIHDNRGICAHAGYCTDNLSSVFRMGEEPWIDADAASVEEIIATINMCPSGALSYKLQDAGVDSGSSEAEISIAPNGPYVVRGCPDLQDTDWGEGASRNQYTLCRCGASKNKPFCDGSHWEIEFSDDRN